ncbi:MAG: hypothetical protein J2P48_17540, partial [Alphaproteobacteria bacterium]|nr:hypothetical protein [Alphaproteobacteria bacterium]
DVRTLSTCRFHHAEVGSSASQSRSRPRSIRYVATLNNGVPSALYAKILLDGIPKFAISGEK